MKFLLLMWAVFQMFSFTASDTNSTTKWYTFINSTNLAKPGCDSRCGDLIVPYPFGVGDNSECYINEGFRIYCNTSLNPPKATIYEDSYTSIKLISDSTIRLFNRLASRCNSADDTASYFPIRMRFYVSPYSLSKVNKFTVIGCDSSAFLSKIIMEGSLVYDIVTSTGCSVYCSYPEEVVAGECTGNGCCQSSIRNGITNYVTRIPNSSVIESRRWALPCTYAFVGEENVFKFKGLYDIMDTNITKKIEDTVPIVLEWAIGDLSCSEAKATDGLACQLNSICVNSTRESGGYRCECKEGYEGNPYLSPGCKDINECEDPRTFPCYGDCINTPGSYNCTCLRGTTGDAKTQNGCQPVAPKGSRWKIYIFITGVVLGTGILVLSIGAYKLIQKRKDKRRKEKFFKRNGGLLLQQQTSNG